MLLEKITACVINYLVAQVKSGAQVLQIFDSWGGLLSHDSYSEFSLKYLKKIVDKLKLLISEDVPVIVYTKGGGQWLSKIASINCDCIGLDSVSYTHLTLPPIYSV